MIEQRYTVEQVEVPKPRPAEPKSVMGKWIRDLRSGKYSQCRWSWRQDFSAKPFFHKIGVTGVAVYPEQCEAYCAVGLLHWVTLGHKATERPALYAHSFIYGSIIEAAMQWNDLRGLTFPEIADRVEAYCRECGVDCT